MFLVGKSFSITHISLHHEIFTLKYFYSLQAILIISFITNSTNILNLTEIQKFKYILIFVIAILFFQQSDQ